MMSLLARAVARLDAHWAGDLISDGQHHRQAGVFGYRKALCR